MLRKFLTYGAGLIAVYLLVANATGAGSDINAVDQFVTGETKALQGR